MRVFRIIPPLPTAFLLVAGVGIALTIVAPISYEIRPFYLVLAIATAAAASFIAGLLSPRLMNFFIVVIVVASISVPFAIYGVVNSTFGSIKHTLYINLMISSLPIYVVYGAGWLVRGCLLGPKASKERCS